jgi:hypothetical protein
MTISKMIQDNLASKEIIEKYAPFLLKGVHEVRDVPYITVKQHVTACLLCDQIICYGSSKDKARLLEEHVQSFRHEFCYFQLEQCQKIFVTSERARRTNVIATIAYRINHLKSSPSKNHMNELALQYMIFPLAEDQNGLPEEEGKRRWKALTEQLALYEEADREDKDIVVVK